MKQGKASRGRGSGRHATQWTEAHFRTLIENALDAIAIVDSRGVIFYQSPSCERVLGYRPDELHGRAMIGFVHPGDRQRMADIFASLLESPGQNVSTELRFRHKDGSWRVLEGIGKNLLHDPVVKGIVCNYRDITERRLSEERLCESEAKHSALVEQAVDGVIIVQDGVLKFSNKATADIIGCAVEELVEMPIAKVVVPELREAVDQRLRARMGGEQLPPLYETRIVRKDGQVRELEARSRAVYYEGRPAVLSVVRDVTDRKQMLEALRESEERYRLLADNVTDVIWTTDLQGKPTYLSPSITRLTGYSLEEALNRTMEQALTPASLQFVRQAFSTELALEQRGRGHSFKSRSLELQYYRKDGSTVWVEAMATFQRDQKGQPVGLLGITRDISRRKHAEEELRRSEERFRTLFEFAPQAHYLSDPQGNFVDGNRAAEQMVGYERGELIGKPILDSGLLPPEEIPIVAAILARNAEGKGTGPDELTLIRKDGTRVSVEVSTCPIRIEGRDLSLGVARDISERKRLERTRVEQAIALGRAEELELSRRRIVSIQESLRREVSQEIHGSVQSELIVALCRLAEVEGRTSGDIASEVADIRHLIECSVNERLRSIGRRLYPSILRRGLVPAIQSLADRFEATLSLDLRLDQGLVRLERANREAIPEPVRLAAYRIAEEALSNTARHAKASRVTIDLRMESDRELRLTVGDDGIGFDVPDARGDHGVLMMQDYAEVACGACIIRSAPAEGTEVKASFPLPAHDTQNEERAAAVSKAFVESSASSLD
jgi:PAS domain S-box-containing protein